MNTFSVESNIPLTPPQIGRRSVYPFGSMKVGDSFVADALNKNRVASAMSRDGERNNRKFTMRKQPDGTIRIWRIA